MVVPMTDPFADKPEVCEPCINGIHTQCEGQLDEWCMCIHAIHRIEHEEGDGLERLVGRLRGCIRMLNEMPVYTGGTKNLDVIVNRNLEDIAKRLDGVVDNIAVVAHLLAHPASAVGYLHLDDNGDPIG